MSGIAALAPSTSDLISASVGDDIPTLCIPHIVTRKQDVPAMEKRVEDEFVVLMQGGNYEDMDRKGWDTSIQAFALFQREHPQAHLYLHAIESSSFAEDENNRTAPAFVLPVGINLRRRLFLAGVPTGAYTIDDTVYPIHPRAQENGRRMPSCEQDGGFGMNLVECQAARLRSSRHATLLWKTTQAWRGCAIPTEDLFPHWAGKWPC